jgi:YHS domain-containing protein
MSPNQEFAMSLQTASVPFATRLLAPVAVLAAALMWLAAALPAHAIDPVFSADGAAIKGYDPVAYFTEDKAVAGKAEFTAEYEGATWRFVSAANRDAFVADPAKYAPQYGGYCAWAVSQGYTAPVDPEAWSVRDGKLYLNYSTAVRVRWALDKSGNIAAADKNWPGLRDTK